MDAKTQDMTGRRFRAGTAYELVVFDRLPAEEQAAVAELYADPDFYGVLKPREASGQTVKVVGRDTALLWLTLQAPGPLPFFVFRGDAEGAVGAITDLVLDGVLEIEDGERFVGGAAAAELLLGGAGANAAGQLAELSTAALRYAETLGIGDPGTLAARLYAFHRQPLTPAWARRLPDGDAVLAFLDAAAGTPRRRRLDAHWQRAADGETPGWLAFSPRGPGRERSGKKTYKLYVSPAVEALPAAFDAALDELGERGGGHFKVGADAAGLLRPDKMVLYFDELDDLLAAASRLEPRLAGIEPHGVPFSAEIAARGLLSWGMDPPRSERLLSWQEQGSWRVWVVRRLAAALIAARVSTEGTAEPSMPPWRFAVERLRREGVDVDRWTPSAALWQAA
jgi:hypothetical protein